MLRAAAVLVVVLAPDGTAAQLPPRIAPPVERMTLKDGEAAGVLGAGCVWSDGATRRRERTWMLGMADDRAVVKRGGRYLMLTPAKGAGDMGPFTFDRWEGAGLAIAVRTTGAGRSAGTATDWPATLTVKESGRTRTYAGRLNCGT